MDRGVRVVFLLAGTFLCIKMLHIFVSKIDILIRAAEESPAAELERQKRVQTIRTILRNFSTAVIAVVFGLMLLEELNINTTPILTSLGVIGVALGFGAQQLVGDLIAGFFHIFENQIRVGDVAIINGTGGQVQEIRLRTTVLRGLDGTVHIFRNGAINSLSNMTKDFSYFLLDLGVAYKEDTDRVCDVVRQVASGMQTDEAFAASILEPVEILGVDNFGDSAVVIKLRIKTIPIKQWEVGREFRRRLKYRLDQEGIEIPFPHQTIYFGETGKPFQVDVRGSGESQGSAQPI
jgi:small conductance mechanosensitive channel